MFGGKFTENGVVGSYPSGTVLIPEGNYYEGKKPVHVNKFSVDQTEVTQSMMHQRNLGRLMADSWMYLATSTLETLTGFDLDSGYYKPFNNRPALVSFDDAKAFCESRGMSLPDQKQFMRAAKGESGKQKHPTNDGEMDSTKANIGDGKNKTIDVCSYPGKYVTFGSQEICDLEGNTSEWIADPCFDWRLNRSDEEKNPQDHSFRGGYHGTYFYPDDAFVADWNSHFPGNWCIYRKTPFLTGFRCVYNF